MTIEDTIFYSICLVCLLAALKLLLKTSNNGRKLPPSPSSLPVIGHLHLMKHPAHKTFLELSAKYGPIFSLKFGSKLAVVVSSPAAVQESFTKNDVVFANRPPSLAGKHIHYNNTTIGTSPYGKQWRNLRRIGAIEIFSKNRLDNFSDIRRDEVKILLRNLSENSRTEFSEVELQSLFSQLTTNIILRMVTGKRFYGDEVSKEDEEEGREFRDTMKQITSQVATVNPGSFFPILNWIDPTGYRKRLVKLAQRNDKILQVLIDEHRNRMEKRETIIGHLLSLQHSEPQSYSDQTIKGFVQDLFFGGTDTTAVTLEWAMTHLLNNPDVQRRARDELYSHVGEDRLVEEADIPNLRFLRGVISETLRLTPSVPLLVPHFSSDDCTVGDYNIPRGTILFANVWAMHRDPNLWEEPLCFKPDRYENEREEEVAQKLMPFGLGRRACPGSGMAERVVGFALGSLIQCFEWKRVGEEEVDVREGKGFSLRKATPLKAMCRVLGIMCPTSKCFEHFYCCN